MIRTDTPAPRLVLRLQSFWTRALVSFVLVLVGLVLGWQLAEAGHARLSSASQTVPALPELRPVPASQPTVQGTGPAAVTPVVRALGHWPDEVPVHLPAPLRPHSEGAAYGRLNLDGG